MLRGAAQRLAFLLRNASTLEWRGLKTETGIVGLAVDPQARKHLREKVLSVLDTIKTIPETAEYRKNIESTFSSRLRMVDDAAQSDEAIEEELGIQLEQAIKECNDELGLIPKMAEWQPWDVPADYTLERQAEIMMEEDASEDVKA